MSRVSIGALLACTTALCFGLLAGCNSGRRSGSPGTDSGPGDVDAGLGDVDAAVPPGPDSGSPPECLVARCEAGQAATCDRMLTLDCTPFGASCAPFVNTDGQDFQWCDCGSLAEGQGRCLGAHDAVICGSGLGQPATCDPGLTCVDNPSDPSGIGCACDDVVDGVCPDPICTMDPDCTTCVPSCGSAVCGDNGCGGSCGTCALGERCTGGRCVAGCTRSCAGGRVCGSDGCGGSCGTCSGTLTCNPTSGLCESTCTPSCAGGRICGSNGCGGSCGSCPADRECSTDGTACVCGFFSTVTYTFDASAASFADTNYIALNFNHIDLDGTRGTTNSALLMSGATTAMYSSYGCEPRIEIRRTYSMRGGVTCMYTDEVRRTNITIPMATLSGGSCTAPAL